VDAAVGEILEAYERKGWLQDTAIVFSSDRTMGMCFLDLLRCPSRES